MRSGCKRYYRDEVISIAEVRRLLSVYLSESDVDNDDLCRLKVHLRGYPMVYRVVFILRCEGYTLRAIGMFLGVSHTKVAYIYNRVLIGLRGVVREFDYDSFCDGYEDVVIKDELRLI